MFTPIVCILQFLDVNVLFLLYLGVKTILSAPISGRTWLPRQLGYNNLLLKRKIIREYKKKVCNNSTGPLNRSWPLPVATWSNSARHVTIAVIFIPVASKRRWFASTLIQRTSENCSWNYVTTAKAYARSQPGFVYRRLRAMVMLHLLEGWLSLCLRPLRLIEARVLETCTVAGASNARP